MRRALALLAAICFALCPALAQAPNQNLLRMNGDTNSWVPQKFRSSSMYVNWALPASDGTMGRAYVKGQTVPANRLFTGVSNVARTAFDASGNVVTFPAGTALRTTSAGLTTEESRTNGIRNNTMVGAVAGTPGTLPTNWAAGTNSSGLSWSVIGTGTENGVKYVDMSLSGTATVATQAYLNFDTASAIIAASGQAWTESLFIRMAAGSTANLGTINLRFSSFNSTPVLLTKYTGADITSALGASSISSNRQAFEAVITDSTTAYVEPMMIINNSIGAVNITLRIGIPQLELGAFATTPIPTSGTAVTRLQDNVSTAGASIAASRWMGVNPQVGTLVARAVTLEASALSATALVFGLDDGTGVNLFNDNIQPGFFGNIGLRVGGTNIGGVVLGSTGNQFNISGTIGLNDLGGAINGVSGARQTTAFTTPNFTTAHIGIDGGGTRIFSGSLQSTAFIPADLQNAALAGLTQ